jgi:hypothetical protein
MSRYEYRPTDWPSHFSFAVGWDPALETYFAQVMDYSISRDDDCVIAWFGALLPHYRDIDEMMCAVNERIAGSLPEVKLAPSRRSRLTKDLKIDYDGEAPHSTFPKSQALPPLYLLRCPDTCPKCQEKAHVYTLAAAGLYDALEDDTFDDFIVLTRIERLPRRILRLLKGRCPTWSLDREEPDEPPYLMNHCRSCGAKLTDHYVHGDAGAAFYPTSPDECRNIKLFTLPTDDDEDILIKCSWNIGIADLLDFDQAELRRSPSRKGEPVCALDLVGARPLAEREREHED